MLVKSLLTNEPSSDLGVFGLLATQLNGRSQSVLSAYGGAGWESWTRTETLQEELDPLQKEKSRQNKVY